MTSLGDRAEDVRLGDGREREQRAADRGDREDPRLLAHRDAQSTPTPRADHAPAERAAAAGRVTGLRAGSAVRERAPPRRTTPARGRLFPLYRARSAHRVARRPQRVLDLADRAAGRSGRRWPRARRRRRRPRRARSPRARPRPRWRRPARRPARGPPAASPGRSRRRVPSASIELSSTSPMPSSSPRAAHSTASMPVPRAAAVRGHLVAAGGRRAPRRASTDSTSTWLPKRWAISRSSSGRAIAGRVDADLVGARPQQPVDVLDRPHPAADRQRDEDLLGGAPDHVVRRLPAAAARGDVEEDELVGALGVVHAGPSRPGRRRRPAR